MRSISVSSGERPRAAAVMRRLAAVAGAVLGVSVLVVPTGAAAASSPGPSATRPATSHVRGPAPSSSLESEISRIESEISNVLRSSPGAVRTGPFEVSWDGGAVVSTWTLPSSSSDVVDPASAYSSAPSGASVATDAVSSGYAGCPDSTTVHWFCFYEHASYGGRMLQFRDCPSTQSLAAYGFANQTTSWVNNRSGVTVTVYDGSTVLWREYGRSHSSNVGAWANDRADSFSCG
ncbi:MAG TPA: peptidase inhibitor family I36 protein [Actinomycetales bacterium]|nr:peptidase inhibitor family I36 protein [Actinomycetales bacterium]